MPPSGSCRTSVPTKAARAWVLLLLDGSAAHGWELRKQMRDLGVWVDGPTLYRALRALEEDGVVRSQWELGVTGPERKVYSITESGRRELDERAKAFAERRRVLSRFLKLHRSRVLRADSQ